MSLSATTARSDCENLIAIRGGGYAPRTGFDAQRVFSPISTLTRTTTDVFTRPCLCCHRTYLIALHLFAEHGTPNPTGRMARPRIRAGYPVPLPAAPY